VPNPMKELLLIVVVFSLQFHFITTSTYSQQCTGTWDATFSSPITVASSLLKKIDVIGTFVYDGNGCDIPNVGLAKYAILKFSHFANCLTFATLIPISAPSSVTFYGGNDQQLTSTYSVPAGTLVATPGIPVSYLTIDGVCTQISLLKTNVWKFGVVISLNVLDLCACLTPEGMSSFEGISGSTFTVSLTTL